MIFESHAHYDDDRFNEDRETLLNSLRDNNIEYVINVGASIDSTRTSIELAEKYNYIYAAAGVHPSETRELDEESYIWLKSQTNHDKVVAVGEIGLDYYYEDTDRKVQKYWFERQIELAKEVNLPMIIHSRDAAKDTEDIMVSCKSEEVGGVIHCFSYSKEIAKKYIDMGFFIGIGGVVTFNNSKKLKEVVEYIPIENIVLETDSPYLTPVPNRGKRNSSLNLIYVADEIARIKGMTSEEVIEVTNKNAKRLYRF